VHLLQDQAPAKTRNSPPKFAVRAFNELRGYGMRSGNASLIDACP
jgi:hypothetical protein